MMLSSVFWSLSLGIFILYAPIVNSCHCNFNGRLLISQKLLGTLKKKNQWKLSIRKWQKLTWSCSRQRRFMLAESKFDFKSSSASSKGYSSITFAPSQRQTVFVFGITDFTKTCSLSSTFVSSSSSSWSWRILIISSDFWRSGSCCRNRLFRAIMFISINLYLLCCSSRDLRTFSAWLLFSGKLMNWSTSSYKKRQH